MPTHISFPMVKKHFQGTYYCTRVNICINSDEEERKTISKASIFLSRGQDMFEKSSKVEREKVD